MLRDLALLSRVVSDDAIESLLGWLVLLVCVCFTALLGWLVGVAVACIFDLDDGVTGLTRLARVCSAPGDGAVTLDARRFRDTMILLCCE